MDVGCEAEDPVVHAVRGEDGARVALSLAAFLVDDLQGAPGGQVHPPAQASGAAQPVQHAGDSPGILAQLARLPLEAVHLLNDLDRNQNMVVLEPEEGIGVVEEDVCIENVVLLHAGRLLCWTDFIRSCHFASRVWRRGSL